MLIDEKVNYRVFVNSFPKGGTHLIAKLLKLIGFSYDHLYILGSGEILKNEGVLLKIIRGLYRGGWFPSQEFVLGGVDVPVGFRANWVRKRLRKVNYGHVLGGHFRFSENLLSILEESKYRIVFIIRDPRDIVISHANYVCNTPGHFLYDHYQNELKDRDSRIMFSITGGRVDGIGYFESVRGRCLALDGWRYCDNVLTIRFEDLIGPEGGGDLDIQLNTINNVIDYFSLDEENINMTKVRNSLFGGTRTFRKGKIGNWRDVFTTEQRLLFNSVAGDILDRWGYQ